MAFAKHAYDKMPDEQLMNLVAGKDAQAFEVLYDRYGRLLYNYFHRMLWKDREKARDFTQDLFSKIIQKPHLFDTERSFKTWLYSIAHNMCKNEYAKQEVRSTARKQWMNDTSSASNESPGKMDKELFQKKLAQALQELDETKRTTFELRFVQELSVLEISEIMQCSEGTVKSRLFYLLKELNKKLKAFEGIFTCLIVLIIHWMNK